MDKKKILLIEPDKEQNEIFVKWLKGEGYDVKPVDEPRQIKPLLSAEPFDILIMDIDAPGITETCFRLMQTLKKDEYLSALPITVLTYKKDVKKIVTSIEAGVDDFMLKPFETDEFLRRMRVIFEEIALKEKGKKILNLNYINYLIKLAGETGRDDFFLLSATIFNRLIMEKINPIIGEPIIMVIAGRLQKFIGNDYGFMKKVRFSNARLFMDEVDKASKDVSVEELSRVFRDYVYGFLHLLQTLTSDILMERKEF